MGNLRQQSQSQVLFDHRGRKQLTEDAAYWQRLSTVMDRVLALSGEEAEP